MKTLTGTGLQELILKIKTALSGKISTSDVVTATAIDIDTTPTSSSSNLITSGGVYTSLQSKENTSNKTTTLTAQSTNTQYPSAKVVYDKLALKANLTDIPDVINNTTSTSTDDALSANMGKELQTEINNLKNIGRFLAIWDASTGSPTSEPTTSPYTYKVGDYFRIGVAGTKNPATNLTYVTGGVNWVTGDSLEIGDVVYCSTVTASATTWVRQASSGGGTVQDVTFNGTSILSSGIAALSDTDIKQVKYEAQSLTDGQKSQARANIGAADAADLNDKISSTTVSGQSSTPTFPFVEYASQSLTTAEKQQARSNIGAEESGTCLPLTGGTVNGNVNINGSNGWTANASSSVVRVSEAHTDGDGLAIQSTSSSSDVYLLNAVYGQNTLGYGGTSAFVVNANGNVGIGTESPSAKLDINGQGKMTGIQYRRDIIQPRTTGWYTFYEMGTSTEHRYVKFFIHKSWGSQSNLAVLGEVIVQTFNTVAYKDIHQIGGGISVRVVSGEWKNRTYLQFRDAYATEDYRIFTEGTGEQVYPTLEDTVPSGYIAIEL